MHGNAGKKQSPEHIAKRVAAWRESAAHEKSRQRFIELNKSRKGKSHSAEHREKVSAKLMGRSREWLCGRTMPEEHRRNISRFWAAHPEQHNHYKDGKSAERTGARRADMGRLDYRLWREAVFKRDEWTCVGCDSSGVYLHADHIKPYSSYPELRYEVSNGRTLCVACHRATPTWGGRCRVVREAA